VSSALADEEGFQPIFDGKTLDGWDGNPNFWRVEDGTITGQTTADNPTQGNTFLIWRKGEPGDFELRLKFRIVGGNSGIQYRSREVEKWVIAGYQADIDSKDQYIGILYEERARGILAMRGKRVEIDEQGNKADVGTTADEKTILDSIKKEDWNEYAIKAVGNHLVQSINGHVTVDVTDNQASRRAMSGLLALQLHAGPPMLVQFKDILLKRLDGGGNASAGGSKKVVFVAGRPSHGYGAHEHNAGCLLLAHYLQQNAPGFQTDVYQNGWPSNGIRAFDGADAVVVYCDGGGGHVLMPHLAEFDQVMKRGVGLVCLHYAVEIPKGDPGDRMLDWMGGYFETDWSVNPHWTAEFAQFPDHPIARGVRPFEINDEWYFHMRFRPQMQHVTPILSAHPPADTMSRPDGPHSGNPAVRAAMQRGEMQHVAWAAERPDGGRGFGFTGGHFHWNWGDDNFRKLVLNAIVWTAHGEVPADGVGGATPSRKELEANQDEPKPDRQSSAKKN
jgi:type 1 glutamine amidotransferase